MKGKNVVIYYRNPPTSRKSDRQIANDIDDVKFMFSQSNWKLIHTFVDKGDRATMYETMIDFVTNAQNGISAYICLTADFSKLGSYQSLPLPKERTTKPDAEKFTGGGIPLGFVLNDNGVFEADKEKAGIITEIYKLKANGFSLQQIADTMNRKGVKTSRGGIFTKQAIAAILKNRSNIGEYECGGKIQKIPQIISRQLFNKANSQNKTNLFSSTV